MAIRPWHATDLPALAALNTAAVPAVNALDQDALGALLTDALTGLVALSDGIPIGFVICLPDGLPYASENYRWFARRYHRFAYIDRAVVDDAWRGRGVGGALYGAVEARLAGQRPVLTCEVNAEPPNPRSMRFHIRRGFAEVGRQATEGGTKSVVLLAKDL